MLNFSDTLKQCFHFPTPQFYAMFKMSCACLDNTHSQQSQSMKEITAYHYGNNHQ